MACDSGRGRRGGRCGRLLRRHELRSEQGAFPTEGDGDAPQCFSQEIAQSVQNGGGFAGGAGGGFPGFGAGGRQGGAAGGSGGFLSGDVIASDAESITVKMADGSSKIVFFSGSTSISRQAEGSVSDLTDGTSVLVTGASNADGSITAQTIQIRPAGGAPFGPGRNSPTTTPTS